MKMPEEDLLCSLILAIRMRWSLIMGLRKYTVEEISSIKNYDHALKMLHGAKKTRDIISEIDIEGRIREILSDVLPNIKDRGILFGMIDRSLPRDMQEMIRERLRAPEIRGFLGEIQIGTGPTTIHDFHLAAQKHGNEIQKDALDILYLSSFEACGQPTKLDLFVATTKELTGKEIATTAEVYDGAKQRGWMECFIDVPLQLLDQPGLMTLLEKRKLTKHILIGVKPVNDFEGHPCVFYVSTCYCGGNHLFLTSAYGCSKEVGVWEDLCSNTYWMFCKIIQ